MAAIKKSVIAAVERLNNVPTKGRDCPDWRIAKGLLSEAAVYANSGWPDLAQRLLDSALPYLTVAERAK